MTRIRTNEGKLLYARQPEQLSQVIEPRHVAMMNTMMQETLLSGTARKAEIPGWMAAGKTGTSQDFRDAWFIGYTANLVTGVWLGNDDNSPTKKATGGGLPVEVWTRFMRTAHQGVAGGGPAELAARRLHVEPVPDRVAGQRRAEPVGIEPVRAPVPSGGGYRPPPARTSAPPPNPSARPEASGGTGWLAGGSAVRKVAPEFASAMATLSENAGLRNWTGETLTATLTSSGQEAASEQALFNTHSPSSLIIPVSSATGMNSAGEIMPRSG